MAVLVELPAARNLTPPAAVRWDAVPDSLFLQRLANLGRIMAVVGYGQFMLGQPVRQNFCACETAPVSGSEKQRTSQSCASARTCILEFRPPHVLPIGLHLGLSLIPRELAVRITFIWVASMNSVSVRLPRAASTSRMRKNTPCSFIASNGCRGCPRAVFAQRMALWQSVASYNIILLEASMS